MKNKKFPIDMLPLGGWVSPPSSYYGTGVDYISDDVFADVKRSGINILHTNIDRLEHFDELDRFIKCAERQGVYLIIGDDSFMNSDPDEQKSIEFIEYCKKSPAVIGINFRDEPNASCFDKLSGICKKYKPYMGDLLFFVNLLPMYAYAPHLMGRDAAEGEVLKFPTEEQYEEYLNLFLDKVDVDVLCYDYYPFTNEKGVIKSSYFKNISVARKVAKERNLPLWNFTQVTSWKYDMVRNMTYSEILWQTNASLCYGVEGVNYFCYWTPFDCNGEYFNSAMISRQGDFTDSYFFVQDINKQLSVVQKYLLDYEYKGIISFGETLAEVPLRDNLFTFGKIKNIYCGGCLIGCLQKNCKNGYYVMNTSVTEARRIHLDMTEKSAYKSIKGGVTEEFTTDAIQVVLQPGEAVLILEQ